MKMEKKIIELFNHTDIPNLLDKVCANIFIADVNFVIVWINQSAKELLKVIGPFVQIEKPEDFIGENISRFHSEKVIEFMKNVKLPYDTTITLFQRFKCNIVVEALTSEAGKKIGHVLTWKDLTEFECAIKERDKKIKQLDTPIIRLTNDTAVIVPIVGELTEERINFIEEKVLKYCSNFKILDALFDLSGVSGGIDPYIAQCMMHMDEALKLMGVELIYVGITPELAQSLVKDHIFFNAKTFSTFKQGVFYIWDKSSLILTKKS